MVSSGPVVSSLEKSVSDIEIVAPLGEGSMFCVYKARCGAKYVILKTSIAQDGMSVEILRREYQLGRTLSHCSIVNTLDFLEDTPLGTAIVMEYIEGDTLTNFLKRNPSRAARRVVLNDILNAMDYLHHRGIRHNDLNASNIIVSADGYARIIDFGFSVSDDSVYKQCIGGSTGHTAPELLDGTGDAGITADIYSLGKIVQMLFPNSYRSVVARACHKNPVKRYANVEALRRAIARAKRRPYIAVVSLLVVAVLSTLLFLRSQGVNRSVECRDLDSAYNHCVELISQYPCLDVAHSVHQRYVSYYIALDSRLDDQRRAIYRERFLEQNSKLIDSYASLPGISEFDEQTQNDYIEFMVKMWIDGQ